MAYAKRRTLSQGGRHPQQHEEKMENTHLSGASGQQEGSNPYPIAFAGASFFLLHFHFFSSFCTKDTTDGNQKSGGYSAKGQRIQHVD